VKGVTVTNGGLGYASPPTVTIDGVRRMVSGYVIRNGSYGTDNLVITSGTVTLRSKLPVWAAAAQTGPTLLSTPNTAPQSITPAVEWVVI
jgi:hypothetical protein